MKRVRFSGKYDLLITLSSSQLSIEGPLALADQARQLAGSDAEIIAAQGEEAKAMLIAQKMGGEIVTHW